MHDAIPTRRDAGHEQVKPGCVPIHNEGLEL
jgi:hypothetical protein